jgi:hypothetical protein
MASIKSWGKAVIQKIRDLAPASGFAFGRQIVMFQSDDWGRVGLRDCEGFEELRAAGLPLGERPYDLYTLETADDVLALGTTLKKHRDSFGQHPCLQMNFLTGNLDFAKMKGEGWQRIHILPLADGLPAGWRRSGLIETYLSGIADGAFYPALHGTTHFCRTEVERNIAAKGDRAELLRTLWQASTPYIYWRMPWIGYEYWTPENHPDERFLPKDVQKQLIGETVGAFARMFGTLPISACAPGYRANEDTVRGWAQHGIKVAQNGPGTLTPPYFDGNDVLQLSRTIEFEPAVQERFSLEACLETAESCFALGIPAIVSVHSINFHSSVRDFRSQTIKQLDAFLGALESKYSDLLYLHDAQLYELVQSGSCKTLNGAIQVDVIEKKFRTRAVGKKVV